MFLEQKQCASRRTGRSVCIGLGITLALVLISASALQAQDAYCPPSVSVKQAVDAVPDGWFAGQDKSPLQLSALTFFDGPPVEEASLAYDSWTKHNGLAHGVWHFTPNTMRGTWLSCHYSGTNVVLNKKLPPSTSECTVTYDPKVTIAGNPEIKKIDCH
jgi:hypothetical protein